ncbi:DMT family transporter [Pigmentibacter sp. JX0631]|uniref:DMT family transporter n=1 Tax=Pigmentibacter sp. JX0631 TaxID=2976982 RepID=UPI0024699B55|nr:DMT family transporter [Pigmentibacter sp. JX0631]WGL60779.1 DMT family transporter [Pigmentibacter sp. JX0631]
MLSLPVISSLICGILLAVMNNLNGILAKYTTPLYSSWVAHGVGSITAVLILIYFLFRKQKKEEIEKQIMKNRTYYFYYIGGIIGACTVIFSSIAINSVIGLSGTLSLMLLGSVCFGIFSDLFGIFGTAKKKFQSNDIFVISFILLGSWLIIFCR